MNNSSLPMIFLLLAIAGLVFGIGVVAINRRKARAVPQIHRAAPVATTEVLAAAATSVAEEAAAVEAVAADLAVVHGPVEQRHPVLGAGLGEDVAHVVVDGALADRQLLGDLLVRQPGGH